MPKSTCHCPRTLERVSPFATSIKRHAMHMRHDLATEQWELKDQNAGELSPWLELDELLKMVEMDNCVPTILFANETALSRFLRIDPRTDTEAKIQRYVHQLRQFQHQGFALTYAELSLQLTGRKEPLLGRQRSNLKRVHAMLIKNQETKELLRIPPVLNDADINSPMFESLISDKDSLLAYATLKHLEYVDLIARYRDKSAFLQAEPELVDISWLNCRITTSSSLPVVGKIIVLPKAYGAQPQLANTYLTDRIELRGKCKRKAKQAWILDASPRTALSIGKQFSSAHQRYSEETMRPRTLVQRMTPLDVLASVRPSTPAPHI